MHILLSVFEGQSPRSCYLCNLVQALGSTVASQVHRTSYQHRQKLYSLDLFGEHLLSTSNLVEPEALKWGVGVNSLKVKLI